MNHVLLAGILLLGILGATKRDDRPSLGRDDRPGRDDKPDPTRRENTFTGCEEWWP